MEFLDVSHNPWLVAASLLVAMIAGFTGLSLTKGLSERTETQKKILIAIGAIALGGGIWSMHFVAMLGMQMPILFFYDPVYTLGSALIAILVVGLALLILHFLPRNRNALVVAGAIVGLGILAMHYIGMAGLEMCRALYTAPGIVLAVVASCLLSVAAVMIAYGRRTHRNILLGTLVFGSSVFAVHFVAIWGTQFVSVEGVQDTGPLISNEVMAIGVILASFVLCGAFLLTGVTFFATGAQARPAVTGPAEQPADDTPAMPATDPAPVKSTRVPYEQEGRTLFLDAEEITAIRAEGHYTNLYTESAKHFCIWSITEAEKRLTPGVLIRAHRSYLINPSHVSSFERLKDNGVCHFDGDVLKKVPVSRSRLSLVRDALGV